MSYDVKFDPENPAIIAHQKLLRDDSLHKAACVSEGFCPECRGRLVGAEKPYDAECKTCDVFWTIGRREHLEHGHDWSRTAGWWVRESHGSPGTPS